MSNKVFRTSVEMLDFKRGIFSTMSHPLFLKVHLFA